MAKLWRAAYTCTHSNGVQAVNVFHFVDRPDALSTITGSAGAVRDALHAGLTTKYRACIADKWTVNTLVVSEVLSPTSTDVPDQSSVTIGLAGTVLTSGDQLPIPVCPLVTFYSNAAIRSGHGRVFMPNPGNASALASNGNWDLAGTPFTTPYTNFTTQLRAAMNPDVPDGPDSVLSQVVYSRTRHGAGLAQYYFDVQSSTLRALPHWLRSRMTAP